MADANSRASRYPRANDGIGCRASTNRSRSRLVAAPRPTRTSSEPARKVRLSMPPHSAAHGVTLERQGHVTPVGSRYNADAALERLGLPARTRRHPARHQEGRRPGSLPVGQLQVRRARQQAPRLERLERRRGSRPPEFQPPPGQVVHANVLRQPGHAPVGDWDAPGVDQEVLRSVQKARVRDRRTRVGKPEHGRKVGEQERRDQRCGVPQAGLVRAQDHLVVADPDPTRAVGKLAVELGLYIEPVGGVAPEDQGPGRAVSPEAGEDGVDLSVEPGRARGDDQVQGPGQSMSLELVGAVEARELDLDLIKANATATPARVLRRLLTDAQTCLHCRPRTASSSSA